MCLLQMSLLYTTSDRQNKKIEIFGNITDNAPWFARL